MPYDDIHMSKTENSITIESRLVFSGDDITVVLSGGDRPHIGSVSLAVPRESLTGDGSRSATVSTLNLTGHKDSEIGDSFAYEIAKQTGCNCVVTCGIHLESPEQSAIDNVVSISVELLKELLEALTPSANPEITAV